MTARKLDLNNVQGVQKYTHD